MSRNSEFGEYQSLSDAGTDEIARTLASLDEEDNRPLLIEQKRKEKEENERKKQKEKERERMERNRKNSSSSSKPTKNRSFEYSYDEDFDGNDTETTKTQKPSISTNTEARLIARAVFSAAEIAAGSSFINMPAPGFADAMVNDPDTCILTSEIFEESAPETIVKNKKMLMFGMLIWEGLKRQNEQWIKNGRPSDHRDSIPSRPQEEVEKVQRDILARRKRREERERQLREQTEIKETENPETTTEQ